MPHPPPDRSRPAIGPPAPAAAASRGWVRNGLGPNALGRDVPDHPPDAQPPDAHPPDASEGGNLDVPERQAADSYGAELFPSPPDGAQIIPQDSPWNELEEAEEGAQPEAGYGVRNGMATVAIHGSGYTGTGYAGVNGAGYEAGPRRNPGSAGAVDWSQLSDAEIMLRVREGDDTGFSLLIEKYRRPIVHFMFRMVHNQAVAEELAQEVFLRVYRSRQTYRAEARFSTWLYRIATNLGVNHARDTRHEREAKAVYLDQPDAETGATPDLASNTPTAEQDLLREERMRAIRKHVMALPERQRTAVLMHKYQGMDYRQIGEVLKLSESATKSLLFRAYQALRESLKEFV